MDNKYHQQLLGIRKEFALKLAELWSSNLKPIGF